MRGKGQFVCVLLLFSFCSLIPQISNAWEIQHVNARSAILYDMTTGKILYEQNANALIAPASLTKILTLYLTFEAIERGQISLSDKVKVSRRAASMPNSRMGLKAGEIVTVAQLIKGIAIVSGNDAAVAMAEHISGSVPRFVDKMNAKARELGMTNSHFMTPNGLPAKGQLTTARDILRLSVAYIRRFPGALAIHSMRTYTWDRQTHHNCNRLLGRCPGVDGLKTGFVCASGFNISATAIRNHTRIIAVVLGARSSWIRCADAERLIEEGYREIGGPYYALGSYTHKRITRRRAVYAAKSRRLRRVQRVRAKRAWKHYRFAARGRAKLMVSRRQTLRVRAVHEVKGRRLRRVRIALVKRAGKHGRLGARSRTKPTPLKRLAFRDRKGISNSARTRRPRVRHGKISFRRVSGRYKTAKIVSGKKSARRKPASASAKTVRARRHKRRVVRHDRIRVKAAVKRRGHEASRAHVIKKRANS